MAEVAEMSTAAAKSSKKMNANDASHKQDLPPYLKMVTEAIETLNKKEGSSRRAIVKFIGEKYNIEHVRKVYIGNALKRGVKSGTIVQDKKSFKTVKQVAAESKAMPRAKSTKKSAAKSPKSSMSKDNKKATMAKKPTAKSSKTTAKGPKSPVSKRGRPAKAASVIAKTPKSPIAKRGRPAKATPVRAIKTTPAMAAKSPARKRGRPAKATTARTANNKAGQSPVQKNGRPAN